MAPILDAKAWQRRIAALPLEHHGAGETVIAEGAKTGRLLILKNGAVAIVKGGSELARVAEPGAVFGELSALLERPHTADVRTLEPCEFHVADAAHLLQDADTLLYVTVLLAQRVNAANAALLELKSQIEAGAPPGLIDQTLDKVQALLSAIGSGYIRAGAGVAGYPFQ